MKIVINDQFGGFSLSHKAVMRYAKLKGIKLYPWIDDISKKVYGDKAVISNPQVDIHYATVPRSKFKAIEEKESLNPAAVGRYEESSKLYFSERDIERTDPLLIQIVEEMGSEANGCHATLKILEIPDNIGYTIEEYDGTEWVAETHRTWR